MPGDNGDEEQPAELAADDNGDDLSDAVIEGHLAVRATIAASSREVKMLYVREDKLDRPARTTVALAREARIHVKTVAEHEIQALASGRTHGGIIAVVGARRFLDPADLLGKDASIVVMLDGLEDPYNFGSCVRSLYAAGIDGLALPHRNWMSAAGVVTRASAGASEHMPTAVFGSALAAAEFFRSHGYTVACAADAPQAVPMYSCDFTRKVFLLIGGEKRGITRSFLSDADTVVKIPYGRDTGIALDAAAATAALAFEALRQRSASKPAAAPAPVPKRPDGRIDRRGRDLLRKRR